MLTVYKASAGSGKTYQLTEEYIIMLLSSQQANAHRSILAVTFTNKATGEMKSRILKELFTLSQHPESSKHKNTLMQQLQLTDVAALQKKARFRLIELLHDYSFFNISTIDSFFQQTIRAFTKEIGISSSYNVELDDKNMLSIATDNLLDGISKTEKKELLQWLIEFSEQEIENGNSWNIKRKIEELGKELTKEVLKKRNTAGGSFNNKIKIRDLKKELFRIKRDFESSLYESAQKGISLIKQYNLDISDFKHGKGSGFSLLYKLQNKTFEKPKNRFYELPDNLDAWITKDNNREAISAIYENGLNDIIKEILAIYENQQEAYYTALSLRKTIFQLGILTDLEKELRTYTKDNNLFLLSDSAELLHEIIDGSDTPFIYEKTGTFIDHYMIDEFQDTSDMQWENFRPLIQNSNAHGKANLIVGDVKQSIYRFRGANWELLQEQLHRDFPENNSISLDTNWRSDKNIVRFNNSFFEQAKKNVQRSFNEKTGINSDNILNAYQDVSQHIAPNINQDGYVNVRFFSKKNEENTPVKEQILNAVLHTISEVRNNGFSYGDIAILVRNRIEGLELSKFLLKKKCDFNIISEDALLLSSSKAIRFILCIMEWILNPNNDINNRMLLQLSGKHIKQELEKKSFSETLNQEQLRRLNQLKQLPLFELTDPIVHLFNLAVSQAETAFIQSFQDIILAYSSANSADLDSFLRWWKENEAKNSISTPEDADSIRITTIHKSKGLEYPIVIVPFCTWAFYKNDLIWCKGNNAEILKDFSLLPIMGEKNLENTHFKEDYFHELLHTYMDNFNAMYVAFTRAKKGLYIFAETPGEKTTTLNAATLLYETITTASDFPSEKPCCPLNQHIDEETATFSLGTLPRNETVKNEVNGKITLSMPTYFPLFDKKLRLKSENFLTHEENPVVIKINYGMLMHEVLEYVFRRDDIYPAVEKLQKEGKISEHETIVIIKKLETFFDNQLVKEWFSNNYLPLNENPILTPQQHIYRPDKILIQGKNVVILDFKFGEKRSSHKKQVNNYISIIKKMGYTTVEGYICYIETNEINQCANVTIS